MKRRLMIFASILLFGLMVSSFAMGVAASQSIAADTEIKLGGLFPLTGTLAGGGVEREAAFRMAIQEINANDSLLNGYKLVPVVKDTATDPSTGAQVAGEVISQGVVGIVGAASSSVSKAIASGPAKTNKVPQISYSSTNADLSNKSVYPYFLRVVPPDSVQGFAVANIVKEFGWKQVATLATSDDYGAGGIGVFESSAKDLGINVVASEKFTQSATDIKTQLQNIKDSGAKVIVLNVIVGDAITVFSQASDLGLTSANGYVWVGTDGPTQATVFENSTAIKDAMQGMIGTSPNRGTGPVYDHFLDLWENCYNGSDDSEYAGCGDRTPNTYATFAYDAVYAFAHAIQKVIDDGKDYTDGDVLLDALYKTEFLGATGSVSFDSNGDRIGVYDLLNLKGDTFEKVGTWDKVNGLQLTGTIYWDGVSKTEIPADSAKAPGFEFIAVFAAIFSVATVYRKRK